MERTLTSILEYWFLITFQIIPFELGKNLKNSNEETDDLIKLLIQDQNQQELITWD